MTQMLLDDLPATNGAAQPRTPALSGQPIGRKTAMLLPRARHYSRAHPFSFATTRSVRCVESIGLAAMAAYFVCGLAGVLW